MQYIIRKALIVDTEQIFSILSVFSSEGIILERSREDITDTIQTFFVAEINGNIIGVVSHFDYGTQLKEIRSLAVVKEYFKKGIGGSLVRELIGSLLKEFPAAKIFALSFSPVFFRKLGFHEVNKDSLPEKIWKDCDHCKHKDNCGETALIYKKNM